MQLKTANGSKWITVPLSNHHRWQLIDEVLIDNQADWRGQHRDILKQASMKAPYRDEMLALVDEVFSKPATSMREMDQFSNALICQMFELCNIGIAFNIMSNKVNFMAENLYYRSPVEMLSFCLDNLSG